MKRKAIPIALASLFLGLLFDLLFFDKLPGISAFIFSSVVLGLTFYLATLYKARLNPAIYGLAAIILFFSFMVFVRASEFLAFVNILLVMYLLLMVARLAGEPGARLKQFDALRYFNFIFRLPIRFMQTSFETVSRVISSRKSAPQKLSYAPVVRGLLLALPILLVFLLLFSSADLMFKKYIGSVFDISLSSETFFRGVLIALVTTLFMGAYILMFTRASSASKSGDLQKAKAFNVGAIESTIILGSVSLLFFMFVVVQLAYFFGGAEHFASTGYTYAEYARKGFFELITVAVISLLLIWAVKRYTSSADSRQTTLLKYLSGILIAEVMVIMLSAHARLNLYEEAYGFTALRLLSHLFMGWLAVAFVLLLIYIVRREGENQFAFRLFISVIAFFALINLINPDAFIARQNIARFNETGKLDLSYLRDLSPDATPAISGLLHHQNEKLQKSAAYMLYQQRQSLDKEPPRWQSTNLARDRAQRIIRDNAAQVEAGKSYDFDYREFSDDVYEKRPAAD